MRILLDEGLPLRAAALLRNQGIDALHVTETVDAGTADAAILEEARRTDRVVVTLDADFHALLALHGWRRPSVIRLRREGMSARDVVGRYLPFERPMAFRSRTKAFRARLAPFELDSRLWVKRGERDARLSGERADETSALLPPG